MINVSVNPTYLCNFRCPFCYLTPEQLSDRKRLDLDKLDQLLSDIEEVGMVDIYGGEIALLGNSYLEAMDKVIRKYTDDINVISNLSIVDKYFLREDVILSVSFDFDARESHYKVLSNLRKMDKEVAILMLASPKLLGLDVGKMIEELNRLRNIVSVEIKPYSTNQANSLQVSDLDFEKFIMKWMTSPVEKNFKFVNDLNIQASLRGEYSAFSDNHVYITPEGKYAVLEFDRNGKEFFLEMNSISEYKAWTQLERGRVNANSECSKCEFLGKCLTEHYRDVKEGADSCNGYRNLLLFGRSLAAGIK